MIVRVSRFSGTSGSRQRGRVAVAYDYRQLSTSFPDSGTRAEKSDHPVGIVSPADRILVVLVPGFLHLDGRMVDAVPTEDLLHTVQHRTSCRVL